MPDKIVEIPGVGNVAFPDSMSDDAIAAEAQRIHAEKQGAFSMMAQPAAVRAAEQFYEKSPLKPAVDAAGGAINAVQHPLDTYFGLAPLANTAMNMVKSHWNQAVLAAQKAKEAANGGGALSASEAIGHGLAAVLPLLGAAAGGMVAGPPGIALGAGLGALGPAAADVGEHFAKGDVAGGVGGTVGLLSPFAVKGVVDARRAPNAKRANVLEREAEQQVAQRVLAPGNVRFRGTAQSLAPQVLDRGLRGSRVELQQMADEGEAAAAQHIDEAIDATGGYRQQIDTRPIVRALNYRIDDLSPGGKAIPTATGRVQNLTKLRDYIEEQGPTMSFADLKRVRDEFYAEAAKHRGYERAGQVAMTDQAWAAREAGGVIREQIAALMPDAAAAYADYSFWKNLNDVLDPAIGRPKTGLVTTGATGGLHTTAAIIGSGLTKVPGLQGLAALLTTQLLPKLREAQASPEWQLASAAKKHAFAEALRRGQTARARVLLAQIAAAAPRGTNQEQNEGSR